DQVAGDRRLPGGGPGVAGVRDHRDPARRADEPGQPVGVPAESIGSQEQAHGGGDQIVKARLRTSCNPSFSSPAKSISPRWSSSGVRPPPRRTKRPESRVISTVGGSVKAST